MLSRTHVAFLRAINIGGRRLTMEELRSAFDPLGFGAVATWQATGNVAFRTDPATPPGELEERIAAELDWGERELWWLPRVGVSTSDLRVRQIEQALGVTTNAHPRRRVRPRRQAPRGVTGHRRR